jgi:hypothetical protein
MAKNDSNADFLNLNGGGDVSTGADQGGLVFNLDNVEESKGFEVLPKGDYPVVVDELEFGESSTGNAMFTAVFAVTAGEFEKRKLYDYWVLTGNGAEFGLGKLKKFLARVCPEVNMTQFNPQQFADEGVAIGRELTVSVAVSKQKKGDYKGEMRNQIRDMSAASTNAFI